MVLVALLVFVALIVGLARFRRAGRSLPGQILAGLLLGVVFGLALKWLLEPSVVTQTLAWTNVVGDGYVNLLKLIVMPLVLVMMVAAVVKLRDLSVLTWLGSSVVGLLVATTIIAAAIGVTVALGFGLTAEGLVEGSREADRLVQLERRSSEELQGLGPETLVRFVPSNIFEDLTGARPTSVIAVVLFGILLGIAVLLVGRDDAARGEQIAGFVEAARDVVMKLVHLVMALTPYGILALVTNVVAGSDAADLLQLGSFILASYLAIALMFCVHALLLVMAGVPLAGYLRTMWPVLTFAFTSRSSAATIPLSVETQVERLAVPAPIANLAATFGATIGQNGCAGIYPAMLAVMVAPTVGVDATDPQFLGLLMVVIAISSFGVAGVGGGATLSALIVLPAMGLPVTVAALLISVEPVVDMARTALNVNGSVTSALVTRRWVGQRLA